MMPNCRQLERSNDAPPAGATRTVLGDERMRTGCWTAFAAAPISWGVCEVPGWGLHAARPSASWPRCRPRPPGHRARAARLPARRSGCRARRPRSAGCGCSAGSSRRAARPRRGGGERRGRPTRAEFRRTRGRDVRRRRRRRSRSGRRVCALDDGALERVCHAGSTGSIASPPTTACGQVLHPARRHARRDRRGRQRVLATSPVHVVPRHRAPGDRRDRPRGVRARPW